MNPADDKYLTPTAIIDSDHKAIIAYAREIIRGSKDPVEQAINIYYAVRDGIWYTPYYPFYLPEHYRASNVLKSGRGYCVCNEFLGTDLFVYHGFVEFYLKEKWVKATPAFNVELCERHGVAPLEFNGLEDSIFQPYSLEKKEFMEYVADYGTYADIPVDTIVAAWKKAYGEKRVANWIAQFEKSGEISSRDFDREEIWKG
ncbi:MAG: transglutaminase [Desulfobacteraceae bacterium 4484_190.2]|nr:MAG: transglutaminase [Desulfobacteraceae bacterium 4484_190.2]